jgi:hypothetical protein
MMADGEQKLGDLEPIQVTAVNPATSVTPRKVQPFPVRGHASSGAVQLLAQSQVQYGIPTGSESFTGILLYRRESLEIASSDAAQFNRIRVRFFVNNTQVFEALFDGQTPPVAFSIPVVDGKTLTIDSDDQFGLDSFWIVNGEFSQRTMSFASAYVLRADESFANITPEAEQLFFHVYRPGRKVVIQLDVSSQIKAARGRVIFVPEQAQVTSVENEFDFALLKNVGGERNILQGVWQVPLSCGPGLLTFEAKFASSVLYRRTLRIAIVPVSETLRSNENPFGIHISQSGFSMLQDDFAYLWGASWIRMFIRWPVTEPSQGHYDFSRSERIIRSYLSQKLKVVAVLGEDSPSWAGSPDTAYREPWEQFVAHVTSHFSGWVRAWEMFNELDVKYQSALRKAEKDLDLELIKKSIDVTRQQDPGALIVCCSTGTSDWLAYDKRLLEEGLLGKADVVSLHPYRRVSPEAKQGFFSYPEELGALSSLLKSFDIERPLWSTEANWILGDKNGPYVTTPYLNEHTQAVYIVRTNLLSLSLGTPFFLHMPFFYSARPQLHLDTLSAYAQMARWFSGTTQVVESNNEPEIVTITGKKNGKIRGAMWTKTGVACIHLAADYMAKLYDFYGNPLPSGTTAVTVTQTPIYFEGEAINGPLFSVLSAPQQESTMPMEGIASWGRSASSHYVLENRGLHVTSSVTQYANQLVSAPFSAEANTCYTLGVDIQILRGTVSVVAVNEAGSKEHADHALPFYRVDSDWHHVEYPFHSSDSGDFRIVIQDGNYAAPAVSEFVVSNPVIQRCSDTLD